METPFDYLETTINGISLSDAYKLGFKAGRKEVVEQVESKSRRVATNMSGINLSKEDWESIKGEVMEGVKTMNGKLEVKSHLICDVCDVKYHLICDKCSKLFWHEDGFLSPQLCDECRIYEPDPLDVAEEG